jgi:hypothetical protein
VGKVLDFRAPDLRKAKISIAMPSHDNVPAMFSLDLASLVMHTTAHMPENVQLGVNMCAGTYVHSARQDLADALLAAGVTHILWLDTDMRFPRDSLFQLMLRNKPVVGINYAKRKLPAEFVGLKKVGWNGEPAERLWTGKESTGLEEVEAIGFGMVLMRTSVLHSLPDPKLKPWFWFDWLPSGQMVGEDVHFCKLLRDAGCPIYVDHDLSKQCSHIGQYDYECGDVWASKRLADEMGVA